MPLKKNRLLIKNILYFQVETCSMRDVIDYVGYNALHNLTH